MSSPSTITSLPLQVPNFKKEDLEGEDGLAYLNQWATAATVMINYLAGHAGPITLKSHLDMQNNRIMNVAAPTGPSDVVNVAAGDAVYGPAAIQPHLDALGKQVLQTARRLNDTTQREQSSTFLNGMASTAPSTNNSAVTFGTPSGSTVDVMISGGQHQRVDGSVVSYAALIDTVNLPTSYTIATLVRVGNTVTAVTTAPNPFIGGETVAISGALDSSFDNAQILIQNILSPTSFNYLQQAPDASTTGGLASLGSIYYYYIRRQTDVLARSGPFGADTQSNRLAANTDGQVIIAIAAVAGSGGIVGQSAAGSTSPSETDGNRLMQRL